jgi:succinate-acetate transporter protein
VSNLLPSREAVTDFIAEAYADPTEFASAVGIYLAAWGIVTFIFLIAALRSSVALVSLFFFLDITFWLLCAAEFSGNSKVHIAGGAFGIVSPLSFGSRDMADVPLC